MRDNDGPDDTERSAESDHIDKTFDRVDCIEQQIFATGIEWKQIKPVPTPQPGVEIIAESDTAYLLWYWEEPAVWMALPPISKDGEEGECIEHIMKRAQVTEEPEEPFEYAPPSDRSKLDLPHEESDDSSTMKFSRRVAIATAVTAGAGLAYGAIRALFEKK